MTRRKMSVRSVPDGRPMRFEGRALGEGMCWDPPPSCQKQLRTRSRGLLNLYVETSHRLSLSLFQCNEINN